MTDPVCLALTFDDGPDPKWTPAILDILKQENVPATFFIIGKNGQAYPDLVRRIVNDGHEVGNHSFTHPNLGEIPLSLTELELNATQRLIESEVGRSTVLFRPPYFGDAEADKPQEVEPALVAQRLGYIMVGVRIDPDDWQLPVTADQIVQRTVDRAIGFQSGNTWPGHSFTRLWRRSFRDCCSAAAFDSRAQSARVSVRRRF